MLRATVLVMGLVVGGCAAPSPHPDSPAISTRGGITEVQHKLVDGRTVTCLLWDRDAGYDSGMSCDWAGAK
jgi:hypothetical protein